MTDSSKAPGCGSAIGLFAFACVASVANMALMALVLVDLWRWFVVGALGLPSLPYVAALGLLFVRGLFIDIKAPDDKKPDPSRSWKVCVTAACQRALLSLFTWGLGWLLHTVAS